MISKLFQSLALGVLDDNSHSSMGHYALKALFKGKVEMNLVHLEACFNRGGPTRACDMWSEFRVGSMSVWIQDSKIFETDLCENHWSRIFTV